MISVCLTTYNAERYIEEQLSSIISQLNENDEIIISDDGSTDNTFNIINSFKDNRIKILHHKHFESNFKFDCTTANIANAIMQAKGDFIFLADQDDVWLENKVSKNIELLKQYDCVVSDCMVTDSNLKMIEKSYFNTNNKAEGFWNNFKHNSFLGCCMAFRKECLNYILPFPKHYAPHDWWIGMNIQLRGQVLFYNEPLIYYRRHGFNLSTSSEESKNPLWFKIYYRIAFLGNLILRKLRIK